MTTADPAEYGQIVTRDDFFRVLAEASAFTAQRLAAHADDAVYAALEEQLSAMQRWTAAGRTPQQEERSSVCIGLIALRELEGGADDQVAQFCQSLHQLNNYFEDWPQ